VENRKRRAYITRGRGEKETTIRGEKILLRGRSFFREKLKKKKKRLRAFSFPAEAPSEKL